MCCHFFPCWLQSPRFWPPLCVSLCRKLIGVWRKLFFPFFLVNHTEINGNEAATPLKNAGSLCPERAFPQGAAAQEALSAMVAIEPPWALCVFLLGASHSYKEWGCWWDPCLLPHFLHLCVCQARMCFTSFVAPAWHGGEVSVVWGNGPVAWPCGALIFADDGTQQFGHLLLLAGAFGFQAKYQGSCLF